MTSLGELGLIYDGAERSSEAIPHYRRAYELANELGRKRDAARFAENLALALIKTEQWDDAAQWNDRATELARISAAKANLPYLARNRARIAWGRGQSSDAARLCEELLRANARAAEHHLGSIRLAGQDRHRRANITPKPIATSRMPCGSSTPHDRTCSIPTTVSRFSPA